MSEEIKFAIEVPGELSQDQVDSLLPIFLLMQENQREEPRVQHTKQMQLEIWQHTKLENGNWHINGYWKVMA